MIIYGKIENRKEVIKLKTPFSSFKSLTRRQYDAEIRKLRRKGILPSREVFDRLVKAAQRSTEQDELFDRQIAGE